MRYLLAIILFTAAQLISSISKAQKIYVSLENGISLGYPSKQISNAFKANGFADSHYWSFNFFGWESSGIEKYPKSSGNSISILNRLRVGYKLGTNSALEISFALPRKSKAEGYDNSFKNFLTFKSKATDFSAVYMWHNKKNTLGVGAGPAVTFFNLNTKGETETQVDVFFVGGTSRNETYAMSNNYIQAGATASAYWRIINKPVFFMDLRTDLSFLAPVKTPAINDTKTNAQFPSIKVNSLSGDINIAFGVRF